MLKGIRLENFLKYDFLFIENINEGFENYKYICFSGKYSQIEKYILNIIQQEKEGFFDFYYPNLTDFEKRNFLKLINDEKILDEFNFFEEEIYFDAKLANLDILKFIIKISLNEILFSTFYFKNFIIWSNYKSEIILFFKDEQDFFEKRKNGIEQELNIIFQKEN